MSLIPIHQEARAEIDNLDESIVDFLGNHNGKRGLSSGTKQTYKSVIRDFNRFLSANGLPVNAASLMLYFGDMEGRLRASTLKLRKSALLKCLKAQVGQDSISRTYLVEKVFEQIPTYQVSPRVRRDQCLDESQVEKLLDVAPTAKTRLLIHFLFKSACRVSEALSIRLNHCKPVGTHVRIHILGKGNKERTIEIPLSLYDEIRSVYNGNQYLFESPSGRPLNRKNVLKQVKRTGQRLGFNISPHSLRHSRATDLHLNKGVSLTATSHQLGHADPSITAKMYIHDEINYAEVFSQDRF